MSFPNCHTAKNIVEELWCILQDCKLPTDCQRADTTDTRRTSISHRVGTDSGEELEVRHNWKWFKFIHQRIRAHQ